MAIDPPDRSTLAGVISSSSDGRQPVKSNVSQSVRSRAGLRRATARKVARSWGRVWLSADESSLTWQHRFLFLDRRIPNSSEVLHLALETTG